MRIHHSAPHDPASFVYHTHRRPLETNVQSCKHPHRCSPSFARGITSGKDRLPAGEQQPHVWDVLGTTGQVDSEGGISWKTGGKVMPIARQMGSIVEPGAVRSSARQPSCSTSTSLLVEIIDNV